MVLVAACGIVAAFLIARAYRSEVTEHSRAEANFRLAADSLDKLMIRVASDPEYIGELHRADELISDAIKFQETLLNQTDDPVFILRTVATYRRTAWIRYLGGVTDKAEPALHRASELLGELVRLEPEHALYLDAFGRNELEVGRVLWAIDQRAESESPLRRARHLRATRQTVPNQRAYQLRLAETLNDLGRLHFYAGLSEKAETEIARAAKISESLPPGPYDWHESFYTSAEFRGYGPYEPLRLEGAILNNQRSLAQAQGYPQALKLLEQAIAVQDQALGICPNDPWCQDYAFRHYIDRAETFLYAGKHREARQAIERMLHAHDSSQYANDLSLEAHHLGAELLLRCAELAESASGATASGATAGSTSSVSPSATGSASADPKETPTSAAESYRNQAHKLVEKVDRLPIKTTVSSDHFVWFLLTCPDQSFGNPELAIKIAQSNTQAVPERASAHRAIAFALYRLGKWDEAEAALAELGRGGNR